MVERLGRRLYSTGTVRILLQKYDNLSNRLQTRVKTHSRPASRPFYTRHACVACAQLFIWRDEGYRRALFKGGPFTCTIVQVMANVIS